MTKTKPPTVSSQPTTNRRCERDSLGKQRFTAEDHGFSMIEVIVAMVIFTFVATSTSLVLLDSLGKARENNMRVLASTVAAKYTDEARNLPKTALTNGTTETEVVESGRKFTVKQTVSDRNEASTITGSCNTELNLPGGVFKTVRIEVSWNGMSGLTKPVTNDALVTAKTLVDAGPGVVVQKVVGVDGGPISGVTVRLEPAGLSAMTDANGCAVFQPVTAPAGGVPSTASASKSGYVSATGSPTASHQFTVAGGTINEPDPLELFTTASNVQFTLGDQVTGGNNVVPFPVKVAMKVQNGTTGILPLCADEQVKACVTSQPLGAGQTVVGNRMPPKSLRFFGTGCQTTIDESLAQTVNVLTDNQEVQIPLVRVEFIMLNTMGQPDDNTRIRLNLGCTDGTSEWTDLSPIPGGRYVAWLPPGQYVVEKWWDFGWIPINQDTQNFAVTSTAPTQVTLQG